jgi:hypothetical protein
VPHGALDLERVVAADASPRQPRRAQVVEGERGARLVVGEQLRARDAGPRQVAAQVVGQVAHGRHLEEAGAALGARFGYQHREQRAERRLDRNAVRGLRLRRLRRVADGASPDHVARGAMHEHDAADEIHIVDCERRDFAGAQIEVGGHGEQPTPAQRHAFAGHERGKLAGVEPRLRALDPAVGRLHVLGRVVKPHPKRAVLGAPGVAKGRAEGGPYVARGLVPDLPGHHGAVKLLDHALDVLALHVPHGQVTDHGADPLVPAARRLVGRAETAGDAIGGPAVDPRVGGLVGGRGVGRGDGGGAGPLLLGGIGGELARLLLRDARVQVLRLAALAVGQADPDIEVIAVAVDVARAGSAGVRDGGLLAVGRHGVLSPERGALAAPLVTVRFNCRRRGASAATKQAIIMTH